MLPPAIVRPGDRTGQRCSGDVEPGTKAVTARGCSMQFAIWLLPLWRVRLDPVPRTPTMASQAAIFRHRPACQAQIEMHQCSGKCRFVVTTIVVDPPTKDRVELLARSSIRLSIRPTCAALSSCSQVSNDPDHDATKHGSLHNLSKGTRQLMIRNWSIRSGGGR